MRLGFFAHFTAFLIFGCVNSLEAQNKKSQEAEYKIFVELILRNHNFREYVDPGIDLVEVNILPGSAQVEYPLNAKGVVFKSVSVEEVASRRKEKPGIEYYELGTLERNKGRAYIWLARTHYSPCYGNGSSVEYEFRIVNGRWRFRKRLQEVWVAEGGKCSEPK